jgi:hypothetical protein
MRQRLMRREMRTKRIRLSTQPHLFQRWFLRRPGMQRSYVSDGRSLYHGTMQSSVYGRGLSLRASLSRR